MSMENREQLLVRGRWLFPGGSQPGEVIHNGALVIEAGSIQVVGTWADLRKRYPAARVLGSDRQAVMPGLINAHHHSNGASSIQHGVPDQLLELWLLDLARRRQADPVGCKYYSDPNCA